MGWILRCVGQEGNARVVISLSLGVLVPIAVFGVLAELMLPMTLLGDLSLALFIRMLWRRSAPSERQPDGRWFNTGHPFQAR